MCGCVAIWYKLLSQRQFYGFFDIYCKIVMKKSDFKKYISEVILNELGGVMTNSAKQTRRTAIQAEIKDLQQQLKDKQVELTQIR